MKKKEKIKFKIGHEPASGIFGFIISLVLVAVTAALIFIAVRTAGRAEIWTAVAGLAVNLLAVAGFITALRAMYSRDGSKAFPIATLIIDGLLVIFYIGIYFLGF